MTKETAIKLFEQKQVRSVWNDEKEKWYFSIIDVVEVLTGIDRPRKYWSDLKSKLKNEGSELSEKIGQLKMAAGNSKTQLVKRW
jgi:prophage antirepressor-like protein